MIDWCVFVQDRLWRAHHASDSEYKVLWLAKIREYQRKQGVTHDEINGNGVILPDNGTGVVLLRGNGGLT